jgi:hypothetical protein
VFTLFSAVWTDRREIAKRRYRRRRVSRSARGCGEIFRARGRAVRSHCTSCTGAIVVRWLDAFRFLCHHRPSPVSTALPLGAAYFVARRERGFLLTMTMVELDCADTQHSFSQGIAPLSSSLNAGTWRRCAHWQRSTQVPLPAPGLNSVRPALCDTETDCLPPGSAYPNDGVPATFGVAIQDHCSASILELEAYRR